MSKTYKFLLPFIALPFSLTFMIGCSSTPIPKPRAYFRLEFPKKEYAAFDSASFPYRFYYPVYGKVLVDKEVKAEKYWINLDFPRYKARIHISYKSIDGNLDNLIEDVRNLAYKHTIKADAINEKVFTNSSRKVYGILYDIKGNAASSCQFYVTDSVKHFLRGALYFSVRPNKDSLLPAIDYFSKDMVYLVESLEWK